MTLRSACDVVFLQFSIFKASEIGDCRKFPHAACGNQPMIKKTLCRGVSSESNFNKRLKEENSHFAVYILTTFSGQCTSSQNSSEGRILMYFFEISILSMYMTEIKREIKLTYQKSAIWYTCEPASPLILIPRDCQSGDIYSSDI